MESRRLNQTASSSSSSLVLSPDNIILFDGTGKEAETPIETKLELKNTSDRYLVFKIKTTRPKQYVVKPNSGVVQPRSASSIKITLNSTVNKEVKGQGQFSLRDEYAKHKFQVQAMYSDQMLSQGDVQAKFQLVKVADEEKKLKCSWRNVKLQDGTLFTHTAEGAPLTGSLSGMASQKLESVDEERRSQQSAASLEPRRLDIANPQSPPAFTVPAPASVTETRKSSSQPAAVPVKAAKAVEDIANQKTAPLNVILVLVAFVLGVLFARSAGL